METQQIIQAQLEAILARPTLHTEPLTVTLNDIREGDPCASGWRTLIRGLGQDFPMGQPFPVSKIIETNDMDDAFWALRAVKSDRTLRLFACDCAELVLPLFELDHPEDKRPREAIEVARKFALGKATEEERLAALSAALSAVESAARSAALSAARSAALSAARSAVESAALSAARSIKRSAAWSAAWSAIKKLMERYK